MRLTSPCLGRKWYFTRTASPSWVIEDGRSAIADGAVVLVVRDAAGGRGAPEAAVLGDRERVLEQAEREGMR
ncbi:hypothetical protein BE20_49830 [Sorangium cellulosum]|nr:hypothetical protein BE20_49830 [Sorangium cellulosum]